MLTNYKSCLWQVFHHMDLWQYIQSWKSYREYLDDRNIHVGFCGMGGLSCSTGDR